MSHFTMKIQRGTHSDPDWRNVRVKTNDGDWLVNTEDIDGVGWRQFALPQAEEKDVRQLLKKEYDRRY